MADKIFGELRKNVRGEFVYICSACREAFGSGFELEYHISLVHEPCDNTDRLDFTKKDGTVEPTTIDKSPDTLTDDLASAIGSDGADDYDDDDKAEVDASIVEMASTNGSEQPYAVAHIAETQSADRSSMFECAACSAKYKSKRSLEWHLKLGHCQKKKLCTDCGEKFYDINFHMRTQHGDSKKARAFSCKVCHAVFKHSSYLNIHMRVHTGETPYMCYVCGRTFISQGKLTHHMKRHSDVKEHKCDQCDRAYHDRFQLKTHINIVHKGIRLFSCSLCASSKFTTRKSLGQHMLLHGEKRYQCKFCDQKFAQGSGRRGHEKRVHGAI